MRQLYLYLLWVLVMAGTRPVLAQTSPPPVTRHLAITGALVTPLPGQPAAKANVIIKNGVIQGVGAGLAVPAGTQVIAADSLYLYAGFISGFSNAGVPAKEESQGGGQGRQRAPEGVIPGTPPDPLAGIEPQKELTSVLDPKDKNIAALRELGFTAAVSAPRGRMLPGQAGLLLLSGETPAHMLVKPGLGLASQLVAAQGVYPNTVIGVMAKWRDLYRQSAEALSHEKRYKSSPSGMERPAYSASVQAFYPVVEKTMPVFFRAENAKAAYRALALQQDLGFRLMLTDLSGAQELVPEIKAKNHSVFLSLNLPEAPKDAKRPENAMAEYDSLEARKAVARTYQWAQAAAFARAGVPFGFSTTDLKPQNFSASLELMKKQGLTDAQLLAALTTDAARLLGVDALMGSVQTGKMGNLVVLDKPLGDPKAKVRMVVIEGTVYEFAAKKEGKADAGVKVAGKWSYTVESPQGANGGQMVIKGTDGNYSGTITSDRTGNTSAMDELGVDGNSVSFSYQVSNGGRSFKVSVSAKINGDSMEGTMSVGEFGSFPFTATRTGNPD